MTTELRTLIDLKDIIGLEFGCPKCPAKVVQPFFIVKDQQRTQVLKCPSCGANWYATEHKTSAPDMLATLMQTFEAVASHSDVYASIKLCTKGIPVSISK